MYKNENTNSKVPDLAIDDVKEEEAPSTKESLISVLEKKLIEIEVMFEEQEEKLNNFANKKRELNNNEEAVKFELSGLHGAKVVIQQLIEEAKDGQ
tara:strand:- start:277 stop:564 length:288 start_codon:yes stop_codon:yes gene_type:complete